MRIPRDLGGLELVKLPGKYGFRMTRQIGSHIRLTSDTKGVYHLAIPKHKPLKIGTLNNILRDVADYLEIDKQDLIKDYSVLNSVQYRT
jgi:predicted RNA binding protein YcfA (HicA-like mRNA interferase family)